MLDLQKAIARLDFVTGKPGSFNLWNPPASGDFERDARQGRWAGAVLLHIVRAFDNPAIFFHMDQAWRESGGTVCAFRQGLKLEIGESILAASREHPELSRAAHIRFPRDDVKAAALMLPFARVDENGAVALDKINPRGDYSQRVETGKFYGAAVCRLVQETGWTNFLVDEPGHLLPRELQDVMVGVQHVVADIAASASPHCTVFQRAASHFFEDEHRGFPVASPRAVNAL